MGPFIKYLKVINFRWKKLSQFRVFWPISRKFFPQNFCKRPDRESFFPRNIQKKLFYHIYWNKTKILSFNPFITDFLTAILLKRKAWILPGFFKCLFWENCKCKFPQICFVFFVIDYIFWKIKKKNFFLNIRGHVTFFTTKIFHESIIFSCLKDHNCVKKNCNVARAYIG